MAKTLRTLFDARFQTSDPSEITWPQEDTNWIETQDEIDAINKRVDVIVEDSVKFAEESPWPDDSEVLKDVYADQNYPFIVD